jgi:hypothetical protein
MIEPKATRFSFEFRPFQRHFGSISDGNPEYLDSYHCIAILSGWLHNGVKVELGSSHICI